MKREELEKDGLFDVFYDYEFYEDGKIKIYEIEL